MSGLRRNFSHYQQLPRIATQPTTQHLHRIDIEGICASKHSLRDGFTAYSALSLVNRALLPPWLFGITRQA